MQLKRIIGITALIFASAYIAKQPAEKPQEIICLDNYTEVIYLDSFEEEPPECPYDMEELELLAHLINAEAGADWCSDDMKYYVGSVALNRVKSEDFPETLKEVIYQEGQYACIIDGNFKKEPTDACWEIAEDLLINGPALPESVVFQAEFEQGDGIYCKEQNMYFCYKEKEEEE